MDDPSQSPASSSAVRPHQRMSLSPAALSAACDPPFAALMLTHYPGRGGSAFVAKGGGGRKPPGSAARSLRINRLIQIRLKAIDGLLQ
jgi:hypothetical protein